MSEILTIIAGMKIDAANFYDAVNNKASQRTCSMIINAEHRKIKRVRFLIFKRAVNAAEERYFKNN